MTHCTVAYVALAVIGVSQLFLLWHTRPRPPQKSGLPSRQTNPKKDT